LAAGGDGRPLTLLLIFTSTFVWTALELRAWITEDWFGKFQRLFWRLEAAVAAMVVAQVAAWRGWPWPLRLSLHATWVAPFSYYAISVRSA
jgi:hypothetical protein